MQSSSRLGRPSLRVVLCLYLSLSACTSWRPDQVTPQAAIQKQPLSMRVTYRDSSTVTLDNPQLQGDTIVGRAHKADVRVPLDTVLLTETRHGDAGKSVLLVLGVAAAAFAMLVAAYVIGCNQSSSSCYDVRR